MQSVDAICTRNGLEEYGSCDTCEHYAPLATYDEVNYTMDLPIYETCEHFQMIITDVVNCKVAEFGEITKLAL